MSRYILQSEDNRVTFVGWDNPLQSFFAQTYENYNTPEEELIWSIGDIYGEYPFPEGFIQKLEQSNFEIPYGIREQLKHDFGQRSELTPLQKYMKKMLDNMIEEFQNSSEG